MGRVEAHLQSCIACCMRCVEEGCACHLLVEKGWCRVLLSGICS